MTARKPKALHRLHRPNPSPRARIAALFAISLVAFLVGVAQVWPPAAWILGGVGGMGFALVGLTSLRTPR